MDGETVHLEELRREFQATVIEELLPGILHNFANPLNGIMGRSKLLQKRAGEALGLTEFGAGEPSEEVRHKILRDVDLIAEQGDRLYDLFSLVSSKIHRLHDRRRGPVNLSRILADELEFSDFYLDFKHSIEKSCHLNMDVPSVMGTPADFSLALASILRYSMSVMKDAPVRILSVFSDFDAHSVTLAVSDSGSHDDEVVALFHAIEKDASAVDLPGENGFSGLRSALVLLKGYGVSCSLEPGAGINKITLAAPRGE